MEVRPWSDQYVRARDTPWIHKALAHAAPMLVPISIYRGRVLGQCTHPPEAPVIKASLPLRSLFTSGIDVVSASARFLFKADISSSKEESIKENLTLIH